MHLIVLLPIALAAIVDGVPINQCSPYMWTTVGKHDAPPCLDRDTQVLQQLKRIQVFYTAFTKNVLNGDHDHELMQHPHLKEAISEVARWTNSELAGDDPNIKCTACNAVMETLLYLGEQEGTTDEILMDKVVNLCVTFKIQSESVCDGAVHLFGPIIIYLVRHTESNGQQLCNFLLEDDCGSLVTDWKIDLPPKPPVETPVPPPNNATTLKVLHISDLHFDKDYTEGSVVYCGEPLCCRGSHGMAKAGEDAAGKWGDWRCDTPLVTLRSMLEYASTNNKDIAYVVWTGDIPPHDVWEQTRENNLEALHSVAAEVRRYFPDTPVFAAVGNHESSPANNFPSPGLGEGEEWSMSWLYDELNSEWSYWLPSDTADTIKSIASYTALAKNGLRIVSLNMNFCYNQNWWLVLNSTDPGQELRWLVTVLLQAETNKEKVHIIGHIPPGASDCLKPWSDNFYDIVSRFESTVAAMFFGHTHKDGFQLFYDTDDSNRAVSIGYVGPSVTTYTELNPGFRLYSVDAVRNGFSGRVVDHETYVMDLETSNADGVAHWYKSYTAKQAYNMTSLMPQDWDQLYQKLKTDDNLLQLYNRYKYKEAPNHGRCDENCKQDILCSIKACRKYGNE